MPLLFSSKRPARAFFTFGFLLGLTCTDLLAAEQALVNIHDVDRTIMLDLRYGTTRNIAHRPLYPANMPALVRPHVAQQLAKAQAILRERGYGLKIWDAWRPKSAHHELWSLSRNTDYVADPAVGGSLHTCGVAVDATLVDHLGRDVPMPTDFDDFTPAAMLNYTGDNAEVRRNLRRLQNAMARAGFYGLRTEWWHFVAKDWKDYPPIPEVTIVPQNLQAKGSDRVPGASSTPVKVVTTRPGPIATPTPTPARVVTTGRAPAATPIKARVVTMGPAPVAAKAPTRVATTVRAPVPASSPAPMAARGAAPIITKPMPPEMVATARPPVAKPTPWRAPNRGPIPNVTPMPLQALTTAPALPSTPAPAPPASTVAQTRAMASAPAQQSNKRRASNRKSSSKRAVTKKSSPVATPPPPPAVVSAETAAPQASAKRSSPKSSGGNSGALPLAGSR